MKPKKTKTVEIAAKTVAAGAAVIVAAFFLPTSVLAVSIQRIYPASWPWGGILNPLMATFVGPVAAAFVTVAIVAGGYALISAQSSAGLNAFTDRLFKIGFVGALAISAGAVLAAFFQPVATALI